MTPERSINHHFTYHIAQASQAKHGSLVDRGANGGLAGSDVRILSRSSRKCTVTGIDSHELQGLDVVQCAALVETNHGIVNLIMNEYVCYGVGSHQVPFPMCTLETLQKYCSTGSLLLTFCSFYFEPSQSDLSSNYELILYFVFAPSFIHMDLSIMTSSTSLTFPEFLVLFSSISLLFSFIESHFALSSARCHL